MNVDLFEEKYSVPANVEFQKVEFEQRQFRFVFW